MSILNVNQIQPVGSGQTITISASDITASSATITASSVTANLTGNVTGNLTGNVTSSGISTFSSGVDITGGQLRIGTTSGDGTLRVFGDSGRVIIGDTSVNYYDADTHIFRNYAAAQKVTINSSGNIVLAGSGQGIDFSATSDGSGTTNSELFDDYEEGEWTPTFLDGGGGTATEDVQDGMYVKIGKMVYVSFVIGTSANTIPGTNNIRIEGLPFDIDYSYISNTTSYRGEFEAIFFTVNASTQYTLSTETNNTLTIRETSNGGGNVASTWSDVTDAATFEIRGSIWYPAA